MYVYFLRDMEPLIQEMPQWRSTAFPRHQKKGIWGTNNDKTNASYETTDERTITKTRLYNFDPLKPHFYIVKLGFTWVYIIFLISAQNIDCGYSLEPPRRGSSNEYPQSMFCAEIWKISEFFLSQIFNYFGSKIFSIFE